MMMIKSRRMSNAYKILVEKPIRKRPLAMLMSRWDGTNKMAFTGIEFKDGRLVSSGELL
jgi:hypothetical protein